MFYKVNTNYYTHYHDTLLIALILSIVTIPFLWFLSQGNLFWVISCSVLWMTGVFVIFHLFIRYIFPIMLTKLGTFLLSAILAVTSIWLNMTIIFKILSFEDIEMILNQSLFNISLESILLFGWFYILIAGTLLTNLELRFSTITNQHRKLLQTLSSSPLFSYKLIKYYGEVILVFILPLALLFWTEITYSSRLLLGLISIGIGMGLFIHRIESENQLQKILLSLISLTIIVVVNSGIMNIFGLERIPATTLKARIDGNNILQNIEAQEINSPSFQLSSDQNNNLTSVYKIIASIPEIGLHLGHRVATIPNKEIEIKAVNDYYTISDQYNQTILKIKREKD